MYVHIFCRRQREMSDRASETLIFFTLYKISYIENTTHGGIITFVTILTIIYYYYQILYHWPYFGNCTYQLIRIDLHTGWSVTSPKNHSILSTTIS